MAPGRASVVCVHFPTPFAFEGVGAAAGGGPDADVGLGGSSAGPAFSSRNARNMALPHATHGFMVSEVGGWEESVGGASTLVACAAVEPFAV